MLGNAATIQLRDNAAHVIHKDAGLSFTPINQYVTLTLNTVEVITVPIASVKSFFAYFTYTLGADVWVLPATTPVLTAPTGTIALTTAQLLPAIREVTPGQTLQLLYAQTVFAGSTVSVGISYYPAPLN